MKKIIVASLFLILLIIALGYFIFNHFFVYTQNGKIMTKNEYDLILLKEDYNNSRLNNDTVKELELAQKILIMRGDDADAKLDLARAYLDGASLEFREEQYGNEALKIVNDVLSKDSKNLKALLLRGYTFEVLEKYDEALADYSSVIEKDSKNSFAYNARGHAYDLLGNSSLAKADYLKAYELNPEDEGVLMNLARTYSKEGNDDEAARYANLTIQNSIVSYTKATAYNILASIALRKQDYNDAIEKNTLAIETYNNFTPAYLNRAKARITPVNNSTSSKFTAEEETLIKNDLDKVLSIQEGNSTAYVLYGLFESTKGNIKQAVTYFEKGKSLIDQDISLGMNEKQVLKDTVDLFIKFSQ